MVHEFLQTLVISIRDREHGSGMSADGSERVVEDLKVEASILGGCQSDQFGEGVVGGEGRGDR